MPELIKKYPPRFPNYKLYLAEILGSAVQITQPTIRSGLQTNPHTRQMLPAPSSCKYEALQCSYSHY